VGEGERGKQDPVLRTGEAVGAGDSHTPHPTSFTHPHSKTAVSVSSRLLCGTYSPSTSSSSRALGAACIMQGHMLS
jgi:hypothetical protein